MIVVFGILVVTTVVVGIAGIFIMNKQLKKIVDKL
jgi:hypothetical protein